MIEVGTKYLSVNVTDVIDYLKSTTKYFRHINKKDDTNIMVSCPFHKDGQEQHPSMGITLKDTIVNGKVLKTGTSHCFTCGYSTGSFAELVGNIFGGDKAFGEQWLLEKYGGSLSDNEYKLDLLSLDTVKKPKYLDESILQQYRYYHPYMYKRKLTNEIIQKFDIGFNPNTNSITFPIRDIKGGLIGISERNVENKIFNLPHLVDKPVYLLYNVLQENYTEVYVCESQINALTLWTYGYPAVALFGTGSSYQYDILNKCGIRHFILCFDGDNAGYKGSVRFKENINPYCIVETVNLPLNKDVNDLSREEFETLLKNKK